MSNQEAKLRSNVQRKEHQQLYSELYFPNLRSTIFSILTGDEKTCDLYIENASADLTLLKDKYTQHVQKSDPNTVSQVKIDFSADTLDFGTLDKIEPEEGQAYIQHKVYLRLNWTTSQNVITTLAKIFDVLNLECARKIPKLAADFQTFKNIYQIENNPIFDLMAFTFALFHKLQLTESLPRCYIQTLMGRRRTTYQSMCQAILYKTIMPNNVEEWFKGDIIKERTYNTRVSNNKEDDIITKTWALELIDYVGQTFSHKLLLTAGPKALITDNARRIIIESDASVCPAQKQA